MLNRYELPVARDEMERCDTMRYVWEKVKVQAAEVSSHLIEIQPGFRKQLITNVKTFATDCDDFYRDYSAVSWQWEQKLDLLSSKLNILL